MGNKLETEASANLPQSKFGAPQISSEWYLERLCYSQSWAFSRELGHREGDTDSTGLRGNIEAQVLYQITPQIA